MKALLEAGVHFGHRTRRWNPKMRPYIFTERSGIHIIDLQQTMLRLNEYYNVVDPEQLKQKTGARIVTPKFLEKKNGRYMFVSFTAKKARGLMTSYFVHERVSTLKKLKAFDWDDYQFCEERSQGDDWVFTRG